jgi:hypothetical protein
MDQERTATMHQLIERLAIYEQQRGEHASGTFGRNVLEKIVEFAPAEMNFSVETGCGKSTVLFSNLSPSHSVFAVDDTSGDRSSVSFVVNCPFYRPDTTTFVLGPTQRTLPVHHFSRSIDIALLDGPHAYPFPDLEYFFIYPFLAAGALLIIDDLHIPSIFRMFEIIREDEMFTPLHVEDHTGFLRRTNSATFPPTGDAWNLQAYNSKRFPLSHSSGRQPE